MTRFSDYGPTQGKEFLEDFLSEAGIKFETQKKLSKLRSDTRQNRVADYYLPEYKVYIQFEGPYNSPETEERKEQKKIFAQHNIPCLYIYQENLRTIAHNFDKKIQLLFEEHHLHKELQAYRGFKLKNAPEFRRRLIYLFTSLFGMFTLLLPVKLPINGYIILAGLSLMALMQAYETYQLYLNAFKRNKFPLTHLFKP